jgi:hypothetical protein
MSLSPDPAASTATRPRRIYVDCTETAMTSRQTGIQRVVRNIVRHGRIVARTLGVECVPVRFVDGAFRTAGPLACRSGATGLFLDAEGQFAPNYEDEILKAALVTQGGAVVHPNLKG